MCSTDGYGLRKPIEALFWWENDVYEFGNAFQVHNNVKSAYICAKIARVWQPLADKDFNYATYF